MALFQACRWVIAAISTGLVLAACSAGTAPGNESADAANAQFALTSATLPACSATNDGTVFYVWADAGFYVCKGPTKAWVVTTVTGLNAAIRTTQTGVATACPTGGTIVQFGLDTNRNGGLDSSEVKSSVPVCNGATGAKGSTGARGSTGAMGSSGHSTKIRFEAVVPGAACATGGVKIESGLDSNDNGVLDTTEVDDTSFVCNGTMTCAAGSSDCSGACLNLQSDANNCGACGFVCPSGRSCSAGSCNLLCASGQTNCSGACLNLQSDPNNCGACGLVCPSGRSCSAGSCNLLCASGQTNCSGACLNLQSDPNNCGACGLVCPSGQSCSAGSCRPLCASGQTNCSGACLNLQSDPNNCGACARVCPSGQSCSAGSCNLLCAGGQTNCSGACQNLQSDPNNCGACARVCPGALSCTAGACK